MTKYLQEDLLYLAEYLKENDFGGSVVLVTGATGLIGSLCVKAIDTFNQIYDEKFKVIALARDPEKVAAVFQDLLINSERCSHFRFIYQDITDVIPADLQCDYIIHTASPTTSRYFITHPAEVIDSIYAGTKKVLDYAVDHNIKGMVYLSSMEVFGKIDSERRVSEAELGYLDLQNVRSSYSEGKRLAELLCHAYAEEYQVPVKIARLAQTFGAGVPQTENRVFAQFARSAIKGEDLVLHTTGQSFGNYCYTRDAIKAIFLLLKKGQEGEAYTVVNEDTTMTVAEMAELVAKHFSGERSKVVFDIPDGNVFGYAPDTRLRLSGKKIEQLGWKAEVGMVEMYRRMIEGL